MAAHMDEIGVIVTFIDDNGFLRFAGVGGLNTKDLLYNRVVFENGIVGVIGTEKENKDRAISKLFIDIGAKDKNEAEKMVSVGDMATFEGRFVKSGDAVISKALDNRAGCYVLIEALKEVNSGLKDKIKDLGKQPSVKPASTTAKPNPKDTYSAWREQMRAYIS